MIKAIIFDCFGVLTADKWKEFQGEVDPNLVQPIRDVHARFDKRLISYDAFRNQVEELTGADSLKLDDIFLQNVSRSKNVPLFVFIKELKKDYKIGLISNVGTSWIRDEFLTKNEKQLFDDMIFSYEVQYAKPDLEIYEIAAKNLLTALDECLLIDDSEPNCIGAKQADMQAILYENLPKLKKDLLSKKYY